MFTHFDDCASFSNGLGKPTTKHVMNFFYGFMDPLMINSDLLKIKFTEELTQLVDYMLQFDVNNRIGLGEVCFGGPETRGSVWDQPWIQPFRSS